MGSGKRSCVWKKTFEIEATATTTAATPLLLLHDTGMHYFSIIEALSMCSCIGRHPCPGLENIAPSHFFCSIYKITSLSPGPATDVFFQHSLWSQCHVLSITEPRLRQVLGDERVLHNSICIGSLGNILNDSVRLRLVQESLSSCASGYSISSLMYFIFFSDLLFLIFSLSLISRKWSSFIFSGTFMTLHSFTVDWHFLWDCFINLVLRPSFSDL